MHIIQRLHRRTADFQLRMIPELRLLSREQRWARWVSCYNSVATDGRMRSIRKVRDGCVIVGVVAGASLGFLRGDVGGGFIGLAIGAAIGGAIGGLIHGVSFRHKARPFLRDSMGGC